MIRSLVSTEPSLALIGKRDGKEALHAAVTVLIIDLVDSFNIGKNMSENQVLEAAESILKDYYFFKIEDIKNCFDMGKRGKFGKIYDRIDIMILSEWLTKYDEQRCDALEVVRKDRNERENVYQIFQEKPGEQNPLLDIMRDVNQKIATKKKEASKPAPDTDFLPHPEKIFQAWVDQRWKELPKTVTKAFIFGLAYGKQMTEMEFYKRKYDQRFNIASNYLEKTLNDQKSDS